MTEDKYLDLPLILSADNFDVLKGLIDQMNASLDAPPELIEEWNGHNIIKYKNRFWGVPHALGELDIKQEEELEDPSIVSAATQDGARQRIDEALGLTMPPELIEECNGYDLVKYRNRFYAIPQE